MLWMKGKYLYRRIEKSLRRHLKIYDKIKKTGKLLYPQGFEKFVCDSSELKNVVQQGFPSISLDSLIKDFEENLFWPRNRILHFSYDGTQKMMLLSLQYCTAWTTNTQYYGQEQYLKRLQNKELNNRFMKSRETAALPMSFALALKRQDVNQETDQHLAAQHN